MSQELDAWFAAAGPREADLRRADALIMAAAPGIDRQLIGSMGRQMLGYGVMPYRPRSAEETTQVPLISLAPQKRYLSMYVFAVVDGRYLAEARAGALGKVSCGKSCIRFTSLDDVDVVELDRLVRDAVRATHDGTNDAAVPAGD